MFFFFVFIQSQNNAGWFVILFLYFVDLFVTGYLLVLFLFLLPDAVNLMVVVAEVMGSVHVLDFVQVHDAEVMVVHVDAVHVVHRVPIVSLDPLVAVATVLIDLLDTVGTKANSKN